jgi:hypothetical protein
MSDPKTGSAFLIAILAAMVLPCAGTAQMQQGGTRETTSTTPSSTDTTPAPSATDPAGGSAGGSTWTAGKAGFGSTADTPAGFGAGATGEGWVAGSSSFGIKQQAGTSWHESSGGLLGTPGAAHTQSSTAEDLVPAALAGFPVVGPPTIGIRGGARPGAHPVSGGRFTASGGGHSPARKTLGSKPTVPGAGGHGGPRHRFSAGSSGPAAKSPSASTTDGKL